MVAVTFDVARITQRERAIGRPAASTKNLLQRMFERFTEARMAQARREIAKYAYLVKPGTQPGQ